MSIFTKGYQARQDRRRFLELTLAASLLWPSLLAGNQFHRSPSQFFQASSDRPKQWCSLCTIALGYTMVYGIIGLINFAHGDLFMLGTVFSATFITVWFGKDQSGPAAWGVFLACLVAVMVFSASINVAIEHFAYRKLRRAPKLAPLITAIGLFCSAVHRSALEWFVA